jgi:hypothetical protein
MKREPVATSQMRQVRVVANVLTKYDILSSLFGCVGSWMQENQEFAQSSLINVVGHGVIGGL